MAVRPLAINGSITTGSADARACSWPPFAPAEMHDFVAAEIKRRAGVIEKAGVQRIE